MIRLALAFIIAIATVSTAYAELRFTRPTPAFPKQRNGVVTLYYMPGGQVGEYMRHAKLWLDQGYRIVIADDQYSAAAMMVVVLKDGGARICAEKGAELYFHLLSDGSHPSSRVGHAKTIGNLTHRFQRVSPGAFGIARCR